MKIHSPLALAALVALAGTAAAHVNEDAKLVGLDTVAGDLFGSAVSVHHDFLAVGAPGALGTAGAVYVFEFIVDEWTEVAKLTHPTGGVAGDRFGFAVAIDDGRVLIGAPGRDDNGTDTGAAYVFVESAGVWSFEAELLPASATVGDFLGRSVALTDTTALIGATQNQAGASGTGFALVYTQSGGVWTPEATLTASDGLAGDAFGYSVTINDDRAAVGAFNGDGGVANSGAAYTFERTGTVWADDAKLADVGGAVGDGFGSGVSMYNATLLAVGAPGDDDNGLNAGATTVYTHLPLLGWVVREKRFGFSPGDRFGISVSQDHRTTVSGVWLDDDGATNAGSAYAHTLLPGFVTQLQVYVASDPVVNDQLGSAVSNHECWSAIGSPRNDQNGADSGAVYMYPLAEGGAVAKNGSGVNPLIMDTIAGPNIGQPWEIEVDVSGIPGAAASQVYGFNAFRAAPLTLAIGELLADPSSGMIFTDLVLGTGVNHHEFMVPDDPWLLGLRPVLQAGVRSSAPGMPLIQLTNAETAIIGCHGHHSHGE